MSIGMYTFLCIPSLYCDRCALCTLCTWSLPHNLHMLNFEFPKSFLPHLRIIWHVIIVHADCKISVHKYVCAYVWNPQSSIATCTRYIIIHLETFYRYRSKWLAHSTKNSKVYWEGGGWFSTTSLWTSLPTYILARWRSVPYRLLPSKDVHHTYNDTMYCMHASHIS